MSDPLIFPIGTPTGDAFSTAEQAVTWLNAASEGDYGRALARVFAAPEIRSIAPVVSVSYPLALVPLTSVAELEAYWSQLCADYPTKFDPTSPDLAAAAGRRIDRDGLARYVAPGLVARLTGTLLDDVYLTQARRVAGWVLACRGQLAGARSRRKHAYMLGRLEDAEAVAWQLVVDCANRWLAAVWRDAVNAGLEVELGTVDKTPPVGILRLGY